MNAIEQVIQECERRGIALEHGGDKLLVTPFEATTPALVKKLRAHKFEILSALESRRKDAAIHLSKQILCGEFDGCDASTQRRLTLVLCSFASPLTRRALEHLNLKP